MLDAGLRPGLDGSHDPERIDSPHRVHAQNVAHCPATAPAQRAQREIRRAAPRVDGRKVGIDVAGADVADVLANALVSIHAHHYW